jgi:ComF family protein
MSPPVPSQTALSRAAAAALNALLPPRCLRCGCLVDAPGTLCADCWAGLDFLAPPYCAVCGFPFEFEAQEGALCTACAARPPAFGRARAVFRYDETSRRLILTFKHGDRTDAAPAFARWLLRAGAEVLAEADLLVPVPLHWTRLFQRRYNQAALLAKSVGLATGLPVAPTVLMRRRRTPSQGGLNASARRRNVRGAFALRPAGAPRLKGRNVVLIDDVLTTGATVGECARVLRGAGANAVDVLTLARVVRPAP